MTRRDFLIGSAAVPALAGAEVVWLEAVVGPRLPERITVPSAVVDARTVLVELRRYAHPDVTAAVWGRLAACDGLSTRLADGTLIIPFESFAHRDQVWREFHDHPEWSSVRDCCDASYQFSIYRRPDVGMNAGTAR